MTTEVLRSMVRAALSTNPGGLAFAWVGKKVTSENLGTQMCTQMPRDWFRSRAYPSAPHAIGSDCGYIPLRPTRLVRFTSLLELTVEHRHLSLRWLTLRSCTEARRRCARWGGSSSTRCTTCATASVASCGRRASCSSPGKSRFTRGGGGFAGRGGRFTRSGGGFAGRGGRFTWGVRLGAPWV
eukprot:913537-Prorocentrum_minimum.AAC.2